MQPPRMFEQMDEVLPRIDRLAGPTSASHHPVFPVHGMTARHILITRQRVADENGIRHLGVERPVGLVGDGERGELLLAVEDQRLALREMHDVARRRERFAQAQIGSGSPSSKFGLRNVSEDGIRSARSLGLVSKAGPRKGARGLFSKLFYVAASRPAKSPRSTFPYSSEPAKAREPERHRHEHLNDRTRRASRSARQAPP